MGISVIVPLYRGVKYILRIIKMVEANIRILSKYKEKIYIQLIFVNDYPDEVIEAETYTSESIDLKFVNNYQNMGIHKSRVIGLMESVGYYIHFLDQDDEIDSNFYYSQICEMRKYPKCSIMVANGIIELGVKDRKIYENYLMQKMVTMEKAYAYLDNRILSPGQCIIKKQSIPALWTENFLNKNGSDDMLLWLCFFKEKSQFNINTHVLYKHVLTNNNTSSDVEGMYSSVDEMIELLKKYNYSTYIVNIIDYRNIYLQRKKYHGNLNVFSRIMIRMIYSLRKLKNG